MSYIELTLVECVDTCWEPDLECYSRWMEYRATDAMETLLKGRNSDANVIQILFIAGMFRVSEK